MSHSMAAQIGQTNLLLHTAMVKRKVKWKHDIFNHVKEDSCLLQRIKLSDGVQQSSIAPAF